MNVQKRGIAVGVDGSPESMVAAEWAAQEANRRGLPLLLMHGFTAPAFPYLTDVPPRALLDAIRKDSNRLLEEADSDLRSRFPGLLVKTDSVERDPRRALTEASRDAILTVVGSRGRGRVAEVIIGSVALYVASHAYSPVAVIPPTTDISDTALPGPLLLGVDGSMDSDAAIAFAFDEAAVRETRLLAALVWDDLALSGFAEGDDQTRRMEEDDEHAVLAEQLAGYADKYPDVQIRQVVMRGRPAERLIGYADGLPTGHRPSLVVLGNRRRDGVTGLVLGANTQLMITRSLAPIIVVRPGSSD